MIPLAGAARPLSVAGPTATTGPYDNGTVLPNGCLVTPAGRVSDLGDFPLGVAVSPDGRLVVAINSGAGDGTGGGTGNYCAPLQQGDCPQPSPTPAPGAASYRQPDESLSVTDLRTGRVSTVTAIPTIPDGQHFNFFNEGVAFSPDGQHLYASGGGNDALYDFPVRRDVVASRPIRTVILPDHVSAQPGLPALGAGNAYTKGLAVTPDGRYVLVAHEFENAVEIVDTRSYADAQAPLGQPSALGGPYPYGVAVGPRVTVVNSAPTYMAYVTEQGMDMVAQVTVSGGAGTVVGTTAVGDHPTGAAVSPDGSELYVANADDDTLSILNLDAASGTPAPGATIALHAFPGEQLGATPNAVAVSSDGQRVYVALVGDDAVAVLGTAQSFSSAAVGAGPRRAGPAAGSFVVGGMIPAGWYPSGVTVSPDGGRVYIVSAKGLGSRFPGTALGSALVDSYYQIKTSMPGILQVVPAPTGAALLAGLATVQQDILHATDTDTRGPHNPIPAVPISITSPLSLTTPPATPSATPIKYVIEIVKENCTFDQILGDLPGHEGRNLPGADTVNVEPAYATFGRGVTPNAHALLGDPISATVPATAYTAFATSDNFYPDGEASVQGHYWTAAAPLGPCGGRARGASRARTDAATGRAGGPCHGGEAVGLRAVRRAVDGGGPRPRAPAGGRGPPCRAGGDRLAAAHSARRGAPSPRACSRWLPPCASTTALCSPPSPSPDRRLTVACTAALRGDDPPSRLPLSPAHPSAVSTPCPVAPSVRVRLFKLRSRASR